MPDAVLVLASRSPRRRVLLDEAGIAYEPGPFPDVDEAWPEGAGPEGGARRLAERKARAVARTLPDRVVLAADTIVVLDGQILGKPRDAADACRMLALLAGRTHRVVTGVAVARGSELRSAVDGTRVTFGALAPDEIAAYVATGEPLDKAGAYGIQGAASEFVVELDGSVDTVVGLPVALVRSLLVRLDAGLGLPPTNNR